MKSVRIVCCATALLMAGLLGGAPARADVIVYFIYDFCSGGCGTPPFGSVTLHQNGTTVDVDVDVKDFGNKFIKTGSGVLDTNAFEFNAVGASLSDITIDAHNPGLLARAGPFGKPALGSFAFGIQCPGCGNGAGDAFSADIVFHVADATIADLAGLNPKGFNFAADILAGNGKTGAIAAPAPPIGHGLPATALTIAGIVLGARFRAKRRPSGPAIPAA
jgi:hypothetical protein